MKNMTTQFPVLGAALALLGGSAAAAGHNPAIVGVVDGISGPGFQLTARSGHVSTPDGNSIFFWGLAEGTGPAQYPAPTLIVNQGEAVTVDLGNELDVPVSLVFPGQVGVTAAPLVAPAAPGLLTLEAGPPAGGSPGGTVRYSFTASEPGTYLYQSGTQCDLQIEMGIVGALIVRPSGFVQSDPLVSPDDVDRRAYNDPDSQYDYEYLFLTTEMDLRVHRLVEQGRLDEVDSTDFFPVQYFYNGRNAPDTMFGAFVSWLPSQPYNCMPMMHPGDRMLMRVVGAGRDYHPHHHHGNHSRIIAVDGRLLSSDPAPGAELGQEVFTVQVVPGQTVDSIWTWTGEGLGWDIYGHAPGDPLEPGEYAPDHGKPFPVLLPENLDLTFGGMWSGSPFLGAMGALPPGEGGLNPMGGFTYMCHSHTEKELTNNDIFPGGMMTMIMVAPPGASFADMDAVMALEPGVNPLQGGN